MFLLFLDDDCELGGAIVVGAAVPGTEEMCGGYFFADDLWCDMGWDGRSGMEVLAVGWYG